MRKTDSDKVMGAARSAAPITTNQTTVGWVSGESAAEGKRSELLTRVKTRDRDSPYAQEESTEYSRAKYV